MSKYEGEDWSRGCKEVENNEINLHLGKLLTWYYMNPEVTFDSNLAELHPVSQFEIRVWKHNTIRAEFGV